MTEPNGDSLPDLDEFLRSRGISEDRSKPKPKSSGGSPLRRRALRASQPTEPELQSDFIDEPAEVEEEPGQKGKLGGSLFSSIQKPKAKTKQKPQKKPKSDSEPKDSKDKEEPKGSKEKSKKQAKPSIVVGETFVDLTPAAYKEAVQARNLQGRMILGGAFTLILAVIVVGFTYAFSLSTHTLLAQEKQNVETLGAELSKYQEDNAAIAQAETVQSKLFSAAGSEVDWNRLISSIEGRLPNGTSLSSFAITLDESADSERAAAILINFQSDSPLGYADTLRAVQSFPELSNVQIGGMTSSGEGAYTYAATMDYSDAVKTNRFPSPEAESSEEVASNG